jgi:hypothetical protein
VGVEGDGGGEMGWEVSGGVKRLEWVRTCRYWASALRSTHCVRLVAVVDVVWGCRVR